MRSQIIQNTLMLVAAGVAFLPKSASAQATDSYSVIEEPAVTHEVNVNAGYMHRFETDIDDGGEFSVDALRAGVSGSLGSGPAVLTGLFNYELNNYDFSGFGGDDPWEQINIFRFGGLLRWSLDDQWQVYGGPMFMFSGESGADASDSFTGGGLVGFACHVSDTLSLGAALGAFTQLEDDTKLFILPTVNWKFAEQWALRVGYLDLGSSGGPGAEVGYTLNEKWKLSGGLLYQKRRYRLEESDAVGQDTSVPIYLKATWMATEKVALDLIGGVTAGGEIKVDNSNGHEIYDSDYDASLFFGVRGSIRF